MAINNEPLKMKQIILQLEAGEAIEEIDLHHQRDRALGDMACQLLCASLLHNPHIKSLNLSKNKLTTAASPYIAQLLE